MDLPDPAAAAELGAIAHGPLLLAATVGVSVGLRCVFAHPSGLHLPVVLVASGVHADAARRRLRGHGHGFELGLTPAGTDLRLPLTAYATRGAGSDDEYREESEWWCPVLPGAEELMVTVAWPGIGLPTTGTRRRLPDLARVARTAVSLS